MEKESIGLFVRLPNKIALQFPPRSEEDTSPPHITMLYIGSKTAKETDEIKSLIETELKQHSVLECEVGGVGYFDTPDGIVAYSKIDCPGLEKIHKALHKVLTDNNIEVEHIDTKFIPHATIEYRDDKKYTGKESSGNFKIDCIELWGDSSSAKQSWTLEESWIKRIDKALHG